jgi:hypothetical protein
LGCRFRPYLRRRRGAGASRGRTTGNPASSASRASADLSDRPSPAADAGRSVQWRQAATHPTAPAWRSRRWSSLAVELRWAKRRADAST